jgi:hypothetical protein
MSQSTPNPSETPAAAHHNAVARRGGAAAGASSPSTIRSAASPMRGRGRAGMVAAGSPGRGGSASNLVAAHSSAAAIPTSTAAATSSTGGVSNIVRGGAASRARGRGQVQQTPGRMLIKPDFGGSAPTTQPQHIEEPGVAPIIHQVPADSDACVPSTATATVTPCLSSSAPPFDSHSQRSTDGTISSAENGNHTLSSESTPEHEADGQPLTYSADTAATSAGEMRLSMRVASRGRGSPRATQIIPLVSPSSPVRARVPAGWRSQTDVSGVATKGTPLTFVAGTSSRAETICADDGDDQYQQESDPTTPSTKPVAVSVLTAGITPISPSASIRPKPKMPHKLASTPALMTTNTTTTTAATTTTTTTTPKPASLNQANSFMSATSSSGTASSPRHPQAQHQQIASTTPPITIVSPSASSVAVEASHDTPITIVPAPQPLQPQASSNTQQRPMQRPSQQRPLSHGPNVPNIRGRGRGGPARGMPRSGSQNLSNQRLEPVATQALDDDTESSTTITTAVAATTATETHATTEPPRVAIEIPAESSLLQATRPSKESQRNSTIALLDALAIETLQNVSSPSATRPAPQTTDLQRPNSPTLPSHAGRGGGGAPGSRYSGSAVPTTGRATARPRFPVASVAFPPTAAPVSSPPAASSEAPSTSTLLSSSIPADLQDTMHDSTSTSSGVAMSSRDAELSSQKRKSQLLQQIDDQFMEDSELLLQLSNDSYGSDDDDDVEDIQELTDDLEIAAIDFACSPNSKEAEEALTNIVSDQKQQPPSESTTSMYWESIMTTVSERARERESVCVCVCACVNIMADR